MRRSFLHVFAFVLIDSLAIVGCLGPGPGHGRKAETGFHAAAPVISGLEAYRQQHGEYPANLARLVPRYVPDASALLLTKERYPVFNNLVGGFVYERNGDSYTVAFRYSGPGMNDCIYDSRSKQWRSSGYY